jgi:hypothetical protein
MSARCPVLSARFAALSLAMEAKCGSFDPLVLEAVQDRLRGIDDPALRIAVDGFAVAAEGAGQACLRDAGQGLLDAVERLSRADPVGAGRADIHG